MESSLRDRSELSSYFVKNAIPTEDNFKDFIKSVLNQKEDGIAKSEGDPLSIEATGDANTQKKALNFYWDFSDDKPRWVISLNPRSDPNDAGTAKAGFGIGDGENNNRFYISPENGNVGIATVEPGDRLDVAGNMRILSDKNPIRFTSGWSNFPGRATNHAEIANDTGTYKALMIVGNRSAGGERRVSIYDSLQVHGELTVSATANFGASTRQMLNLYQTQYGIGVQGNTLYFRSNRDFAWYRGGSHHNGTLNPGGGSADMVISSGNVGIGTNAPTHKFHVRHPNAVGLFESTTTQAYLRLYTSQGSSYRVEIANRPGGRLALWTAGGSDSLNITRDGKVGIRTTNPQAHLHVVGDLLGAAKDNRGVAMRVRSGKSSSTAWVQYGTAGVYMDVDTRHCGFTSTPVYVASLGGNGSHWTTTGGSSIYSASATGFRIYVRWSSGAALTVANARANGWFIHWIAIGN